MDFKAIASAIPALLATTAAFAEPATPAGVAQLTEVFQTYLGTVPGVVNVVTNGESYTLTLDATPMLAMAPPEAGTFAVSPMVMELTDNGDGTWGVTQDQALSARIIIPDAAEISIDTESVSSEGVFDEAMMAFASSSTEIGKMTIVEKIMAPGQPPVEVTISFDSGTSESTSTPNAEGGVDNSMSFTMLGMTEVFMMPPMGEGMPPMTFTLTVASQEVTGDMTGFRPEAILGLLEWAVAHPSPELAQADMAGLKALLEVGLPVFETLTSSGTMTDIKVETPMGAASIASATIEVDANGVVEDGMVREAITLSGLTLPTEMLPPWSLPLLPSDLAVDVTVSGFDLASPAAILMAVFDLPQGTPPDPGMQDAALMALLPTGAVDITLAPSGVTGAGYELSFEGAMTAGPMGMPAGSASVSLTGIDAIMAALNAAPDDIKAQALPMVGMAQGLATPGEGGELVWEIDATTPGKVLINGMDLMGGP